MLLELAEEGLKAFDKLSHKALTIHTHSHPSGGRRIQSRFIRDCPSTGRAGGVSLEVYRKDVDKRGICRHRNGQWIVQAAPAQVGDVVA